MLTVLNLLALIIAASYLIAVGGALVFGIIDTQRDNTTDNRIVAVLLLIALIGAPLLGVISSVAVK